MIKWLICLLAVGAIAHGHPGIGTGQQMKPKLNCTKVGNGNFVYGCSKIFWMCSNGNLYAQHCHSELFFDPVSNACERQENIELCTSQNLTNIHKPLKATEAFNCKGKVDTAYELAPCLNRFAHCKSGNVFYEGCPTGTVYDDSKKRCDWPDNVAGCQDKTDNKSLSSRSPLNGETVAAAPGYGPKDEAPQSFFHQQSSYSRQFKLVSPSVINSQQNDTLQYNFPKITPLEHPQQSSIPQQQPAGPPRQSSHHISQQLSHQQPPQQQQQQLPKQISYRHEFDCTGKKDGIYPTPLNACATFFYKCSLNETYKYNCPYGLYFSTQKIHCEFLSNAPECNGKVLPYPNGPLVVNSQNYTKLPVQPPLQNQPSQQSGVVSIKPALKVDFDCQNKADGFYPVGKCKNDYIRCLHKTPYLQECPENFVFDSDICEYMDECLKTIKQNGQREGEIVLPHQPAALAPSSQTYTIKDVQLRAINQTQQLYNPGSEQTNQQYAPTFSPYDDQQPLYSHRHRLTSYPIKQQPDGQPNSKEEVPQQTLPVQHVKDSYCQDKGFVHGYHSWGCNDFYFACYPHGTIRVPCPKNLFYDSESEKCDYKKNVVACGGTKQTSPPAQQQPHSYPAHAQHNAPAPQLPVEQQQKYSVHNNHHTQQLPVVQQNQPIYYQQAQQDTIYQSATLHSKNIIQHSYQLQSQHSPDQNYVHQQQHPSVVATPAPAWVSYTTQQQVLQSENQNNQIPVQQQPANPPPAWVSHYGGQQQQPAQQPTVSQPQVQYQSHPQHQSTQQPAVPLPQLQPLNSQNSNSLQNAKYSPPVIVETFCRDNNRRDGFNGAGCAPYFFICALGETTRLHCPTGLYYDEEIHECGLKTTITACGGQKLSTPAPAQRQPVVAEFDCQQKQDGVYVSGCSSMYFICNQKKSKTLYCPPGTYYSPSTEHCDYKANVAECGGTAPTFSPSSQHPVLIPQNPYPYQRLIQAHEQYQQQQPVVSNYGVQIFSKLGNAQEKPAKKRPLGVDYLPIQERIQQHTPPAPTKTVIPVDDKCMKLSNGIYGTKCTKFFFVCIEKKSYDFMCPKDLYFNLATVKCAPKTEISSCPEYATVSQQQPSHQLNSQPQPQLVVSNPHASSLTPQTYNSQPVQQQITNTQQQLPVNNHLSTKYVQNSPVQQLPSVVATPAPAWVSYTTQQQVLQSENQNNQIPVQQQPANPPPAWVSHYGGQQQQSAQQPTVSQPQIQYQSHPQHQSNHQISQQPTANPAPAWVSYPSQQLQHQPHQHYNTQSTVQQAAQQPHSLTSDFQKSYSAEQPITSQFNTPQRIASQQSYSYQPSVASQQTQSQQSSLAQHHQSLSAQHNAPTTQQQY